MTTLGKILVFINLLFSLLTGALIIMAFTTRTNWAQGYAEKAAEVEQERKRYDLRDQAIKELEKEKTEQLTAAENALKELKTKLDHSEKARDDAVAKVNEADKQVAALNARVGQVLAASESMKTEIKIIDERLLAEQARVLQLGLDNKKYKAEAIKATTDLQTALERNEQLLAKLVESDRKLGALEGDTAAKAGREAKNPPPDDIRGRVTASDDASGYITINLGSDNGLNKGNTLEVYRLKPRPTYVGTFRVYDVRPNEAVGKLMSAGPRGKVLKDDEVASRILGSP